MLPTLRVVPLPPPRACQLVDAVAFCHDHGAVHGQLHPENILLRHDTLQVIGFCGCSLHLAVVEFLKFIFQNKFCCGHAIVSSREAIVAAKARNLKLSISVCVTRSWSA